MSDNMNNGGDDDRYLKWLGPGLNLLVGSLGWQLQMYSSPSCGSRGQPGHWKLVRRSRLRHWCGRAGGGTIRIRAASKDEQNVNGGPPKRPFHSFPKSEGLPLSLYTPFKGLPPDGKTLTESEESCNPMERICKTPAHVYEAQCALCDGTGVVMSKAKGHSKKRPGTCMLCNGLGYVRRTTSRFIPEVNCVGPNLTINRPGLNNGKPTTIQTDGSQGEHSTEIK